ncbi:hypothetical protein LINGRAHAP2_LOCUS30901 [Linum grandiflorum]
MSLLCWLVK